MPELPEVETVARGLDKRVTGDVIESVWLGEKPEPLKSPASEIVSVVEHSRIVGVRRMGKHIVIDLERADHKVSRRKFGAGKPEERALVTAAQEEKAGKSARSTPGLSTPSFSTPALATKATPRAQWIVHLGMTGRLQVCEPEVEIAKHTHAIAKLASGRELRFVDPRRFGRLSVSTAFDAGGIEPLEARPEQFVKLFRGRKTPIKSALLNQKLLRGVGNIYADESLFRTGIRPRRRASNIPREKWALLLESIQEVLREAIALGGSSISDYVDAEGSEGFFQLRHRVYGREGEPCLVCTTPIKRIVIAGRSSHYCPKCQK